MAESWARRSFCLLQKADHDILILSMSHVWPPKPKMDLKVKEGWSPKPEPEFRVDPLIEFTENLNPSTLGIKPTSPATEFLFQCRPTECLKALCEVDEPNDADRLTRIYLLRYFGLRKMLVRWSKKHEPLSEMSDLWTALHRLLTDESIDFYLPSPVYTDLTTLDDYLLKSGQFDPISRMSAYIFAVEHWDFDMRERYRANLGELHPFLQLLLLFHDNAQSRWRTLLSDDLVDANEAIRCLLLYKYRDKVGLERIREWISEMHPLFVPSGAYYESIGQRKNLMGRFKYFKYWFKNTEGTSGAFLWK